MILPKMLKVALAAGLFMYLAVSAQAQGFYTKIGAGYNIGIGVKNEANLSLARTFDPQDFSSQTIEEAEWVKVNLGKGKIVNAAAGFMFSEQVGAELEVSYLDGGDNETTFHFTSDDATFGNSSITKNNLYSKLLQLQPSLVLNADVAEKVDLYGKFGVTVSRGHIVSTSAVNVEKGQDTYREVKYDGGFGFGFQAAMGLNWNIGKKYLLFSEVKMNNLSYAPTDYHLLKKTVNGEDQTDTETRHIPMEDSFVNINGEKEVLLKMAFPFSYVGLNLGLRYNF